MNPASGLLTPNSFERDGDGRAGACASADAALAVRHVNHFVEGAAERGLGDRRGAMDFGGAHALPNVSFPVSGVGRVPAHVLDRLRAHPHDDPGLKRMAEYDVSDLVFWT